MKTINDMLKEILNKVVVEFENHLNEIGDDTKIIEDNCRFLDELNIKMDKLNLRIDEIGFSLRNIPTYTS